jgi:two-component system sensor histidine kinase KdpD
MTEARPDPDQLLAQVRASEARAHRGRLTVFFGANAGVGKTYAMLEAAQRRRAEGADVVIGYVEMHGRAETERLLPGLEQLPPRLVKYGGSERREFNLDAALARKPQLILVDELAHTNLAGDDAPPRHDKRWQDIDELLDAGIDVYTTVNVQHLESLSDVVTQITGVRQQETLPDRVFDEADEVKLVDLPPDDLLQRLREGRVYVADQAEQAMGNFFRKGNLIALRELALRKTADRVDQAMRDYRASRAVKRAWAARERLMVCIGPDEQAERLVRAGKRLADGLDAEWLVVYVETPDLLRLPEAERNRRIAVLRLAESLGAEGITLGGPTAAGEILSYARTRNVTRVLVGAPRRARWRRWFRSSTTQQLIDAEREFDVSIISDGRGQTDSSSTGRALRSPIEPASEDSVRKRWNRYLLGLAGVGIATGLCMLLYPLLELANLVMIYLLATALVAVRGGRRAAVLCSVLSVLAFDFMFVPPRFTFAVSDAQYLVTFAIMLVVALIIGGLNANVRLQERIAGHRERRTALLYAMTRQLAASSGWDEMAQIAVRHVSEVFACRSVLLFPDANGHAVHPEAAPQSDSYRGAALGIAQWVLDHGKPAGLGTDTLAGAEGLHLPVRGAQRTLGVLAVLPSNRRRVTLPEQFRLLETFVAQIGLALERAQLVGTAQAAEVRAQTEAIRNSLLASISHDLRTPLATIVGGASALAGGQLRADDAQVIARSVAEEAEHMSERITTLLDLVRLESGAIRPRLDWYALDEVIGSALRRVADRLQRHEIRAERPESLPPLRIDGRLIEQVFENLLDNASKYTPAGTEVVIRVVPLSRHVEVSIEDNGPGLGTTEPAMLFEKFQRGHPEGAVGGIGVGLSICRTIVGLHGGKIWAENRSPHGAAFRFTLPLPAEPPQPPEGEQSEAAPVATT